MHFAIYLIIGAFSGLLAGSLGLGGGVIIVPALSFVFSHFGLFPNQHIMHMAIGTSLATLVITLLTSLKQHIKRNSVQWKIVRTMLPGLIIGVILGAVIARYLDSIYLKIFFGLFLFLISIHLFFKKTTKPNLGSELPTITYIEFFSLLIGLLSGVLGIGGGVMLIPFLMHARLDLRKATGTSVACGFVISIIASLSYMLTGYSSIQHLPLSTGFVYWPAFLGICITSLLFTNLGTTIAYKTPVVILQRILAIFLFIVAVGMILPSGKI